MSKITLIVFFEMIFCGLIAQDNFKETRSEVPRLRKGYIENLEKEEYSKIPLNKKIDNFHYTLNKFESQLLALLQHEFELFITFVLNNERDNRNLQDVHVRYNPYAFTTYPRELTFQLRVHLGRQSESIKAAVKEANISPASRDFILFYLNSRSYYSDAGNNQKQLELLNEVYDYEKYYPQSPFLKIMKRKHSHFEEPGAFAVDFCGGISFGFYGGELGKRLSKIWGFDLEMRYYLHNTFLGLKGNVNFNKSRESFFVNNYEVIEDRRGIATTFIDAYLGRAFHINEHFSVLPFIGYSTTEFSIQQVAGSMEEENWGWSYTHGMVYGLDILFTRYSRTIQQTVFAKHKRKIPYSAVYWRFSTVVRDPSLVQIEPHLSGYSTTFTFGLGLHIRGTKKREVTKEMIINALE
jgi:hypothetical protein